MWKEIKNESELKIIADLFDGGAALVSATFSSKNRASMVNDVKTAVLEFEGQNNFSLMFTGVDCLHVVPIATGNIFVSDIAIGKMGKMFFWADDGFFNVTEPDTSLTYVFSEGLFYSK